MKKLIFTVVGALFLFVSCQSDDLQIDEALIDQASKTEDALENSKRIVFRSYEGDIEVVGPNFTQTGYGIATHIGEYTFVNTATFPAFPVFFVGELTFTESGDQIFYGNPVIKCATDPSALTCPGEPATFTYTITGGTGQFTGVTGTMTIKGKFVEAGPFKARGWADFTYPE
jgi:hypothetical protein